MRPCRAWRLPRSLPGLLLCVLLGAGCAPALRPDAGDLARFARSKGQALSEQSGDGGRHTRALREALRAEQVYAEMLAELELGSHGPLEPGAVLEAVRPLLGTPYHWGGESPQGLDCSGFTRLVFRRLGLQLPRTSREQARVGQPVAVTVLRPGDLVFFAVDSRTIDHVGVMVGKNRMAHSTGRRGRVVIEPFPGVYPGKFVTARRLALP